MPVDEHGYSIANTLNDLRAERDAAIAARDTQKGYADLLQEKFTHATRDIEKANAELLHLKNALNRLAAAASPFVVLTRSTSGRIPTERLAFADWHELSKAHTFAVDAHGDLEGGAA